MPISLSLILGIVVSMVMFVIATAIYGAMADSIICPAGEFGVTCESAKEFGWIMVAVLPVAVFFMVALRPFLYGLEDDDDEEMTTITGKKAKRSEMLLWKVLVFLKIAKVKNT